MSPALRFCVPAYAALRRWPAALRARATWAATWLALVAVPGAAQSPAAKAPVRLDEGSFTITLNGQRAGREQFSIQQVTAADGATLEVRAESAVSDRRSAMRLDADSAGTPVRYSVEERRGAELTLRLGGQRVRGRFATLARSLTGEAAREYMLRPGAVVVEEDGIVQHALLVRGAAATTTTGVTLPSLTPIANAQGVVRIVPEADGDIVAIAGVRIPARRWRCVTNDGEVRLVWTDVEGHLLRLSIPARNLDALRDDVPR
ncbi:MAG: hypothetical protein K2R93_06255 [Gemmatimonadaceae bacterium]|nr:hypothetical protein [Gemmatimonadaceae bacterium]